MKPKDLIYPFTEGKYFPTISQGVLFIPKRLPDHYLYDFSSSFPIDRPVYIEFCSGNGEWIVEKALAHPEIYWIAVEMKFDRVQKIWSKMQNQGIKNLLIIHGEASIAARYYIPHNLATKFFINFPDPWPKQCHAKYRLINEDFLQLLSQLGKKEAILTFVTDDGDYLTLAEQEIKKSPFWDDIERRPFSESYGKSYFYRLWKSQEKEINELSASNSGKQEVYPLRLDLSLTSDLKWEREIQKAEALIQAGAKLEIHLDFQLSLNLASLSQVMKFNTYLLSVETFSSTFYPQFEKGIESVVLYRGPLDFIETFFQNEADFVSFQKWLEESYGSIETLNLLLEESCSSFHDLKLENMMKKSMGRQLLRLFAISIFSEYLHRLASPLPEEVIPMICVDRGGIAKELFYQQLISQEMFPHFKIREREFQEDVKVGVVIPSMENVTPHFVKKMEAFIEESNQPLTFIPERYLSENWLGIDRMIVSQSTLSPLGLRQLKGFEAAGGEVVDIEESLQPVMSL